MVKTCRFHKYRFVCFSSIKFILLLPLLVSFESIWAQEDEETDENKTEDVQPEELESDSLRYHKFFASIHLGGGISKAFLDEKPDSLYGLPVSNLKESFNIGSDISIHFNKEFGVMFSLNISKYGDNLHSLSLGDPTQSNIGDILKRSWTYVSVGIGPKALFGTHTQFSFATKFVAGLQMGIKETLLDSSGNFINSWTGLESTRPKLDAGISVNLNLDFPLNENVYLGIYSRSYFGLRNTKGSNIVYQSTFFAPLPGYTIFGTHLGMTLGYQL